MPVSLDFIIPASLDFIIPVSLDFIMPASLNVFMPMILGFIMMMSYGFTKLCRISHAAHLVFEEAWYVLSRVSESAHNRFLVTSRQMWQLSSEDYI